MDAIKAIYDGVTFKPLQPIPVKEEYEVTITFINPLKKGKVNISETEKQPCSAIIGLLKGKVWMSDDFNAPLDDLKEYME